MVWREWRGPHPRPILPFAIPRSRGLNRAGFAGGSFGAYDRAMYTVTVPPDLERFAAEAVAAGR